MVRSSNYDLHPVVRIAGLEGQARRGAAGIRSWLGEVVADRGRPCLLAIDCYPGVDEERLLADLVAPLSPDRVVRTSECRLTASELSELFLRHTTDDRIFGVWCHDPLEACFHSSRRSAVVRDGLTVVLGHGAALFGEPDVLVYADLPRWEIQQRFRHEGLGNWGMENGDADIFRRYKHGYFIEWRLADRHKRALLPRIDFLLDTTDRDDPKLVTGAAFRAGLAETASRPFRVVPLFDPAPWGGQWMRKVCDLDPEPDNFGWCFDCVPEENSLLLEIDGVRIEVPALDLVFAEPRALLGDGVHSRFGAEFPIRFDFLDTIGGGNLSFQVHPLTDFIFEHFGVPYTQDESYYLLDAEEGATVYLGLKDCVDPVELAAALRAAQDDPARPFPAERFVNQWPARAHDHFLIPAGTPHGSGAGAMVLEISATPYIFTFKLWDWGRVGLDGRPRPIHLDHGLANLQWERDATFVARELINCLEPVGSGDGWREERTGLHPLEFIETRRHFFTRPVPHDTHGGVNVLNLVQGDAALVTSPGGSFDPFEVHYAETFIVPAAVGPYLITPRDPAPSEELATMKAFVRE